MSVRVNMKKTIISIPFLPTYWKNFRWSYIESKSLNDKAKYIIWRDWKEGTFMVPELSR